MPTALATRPAAFDAVDSQPVRAARRVASQLRTLQSTCRQAAHDLRAPLQAMTLNLDLVQQIVDEDSARHEMRHAAGKRIAILQREVTRLSRMLEVLAEPAPPRRDPGRFGLAALLREVVSFIAPQTDLLGIRVSLLLPETRIAVRASRDEFTPALLNLLMNALEAMPRGGPLEIELACDGPDAVLLIRDHGVGVAARDLDQLFRLHFTTKPGGSGIGLCTSREAIESMGGSLRLHSTEGVGTTVRIRLPLAVPAPERELACSMS